MKVDIQGMFHTPKDMDELMAWIKNLGDTGERMAALTAAMMAWNLLATQINELGEKKDG